MPEVMPTKFLDSLVAIYNDTTGNAHKHIASRHPSLYLARKHQLLEPKQLISISTSTSVSTNNIRAFIKNGNDAVIERVHAFVARLVVNCKVPLSLATDVNLNEIIQAALYLKLRSYVLMTPGKINRALISMFSKFTVCVKALIIKARAMYMPADYDELVDEYVGSSCGWLVVCHDGWDSMIKQFFGISVYWIDLQSWIWYKLALGLAVPDGHNAQACNDAAMAILKHYGIRRNDIVLSINNTTNMSLVTSRLIIGTDGTCNMHLANLVCDHATRKRKRIVNKEIVDSFEECKDLRLAVRRMIEYVWNKKAKSRKINYEKRNEQIGYNVIKVGIDNDTRISGYARMYQQALRCKWTLHQYFAHEKSLVCNAYELLDKRWQFVAEVEAIIQLVCALSFTTQIDSRLVASTSWPNVVKTKIAARQMTYSVINIVPSSRSGEQSNEEDDYGGDGQWDGKT
jgi:hypothetical protein